jgi:5-methyltetrahydrofolate--homocysteine methyltransferase
MELMQDLKPLYEAVLTGDLKTAQAATAQALAEGGAPLRIVQDWMMPAMAEVGRRFEASEYFVPELLIAARAMKGALELIRPRLAAGGIQPVGRVVLGTVHGDLHDIGKNIVGAMLEGGGFEVIDLGVDVRPEKFVAAVKEKQPAIIAMSALHQAGVRHQVKVLVGGAPLSQGFAEEIGADGFSDSAAGVVEAARKAVAA